MPTAGRVLAVALSAILSACTPRAHVVRDYGPAPSFTLPDASGGTFSLAQQERRGNVVVLTFVAANCTEECPELEAVLKRAAERWSARGQLGTRVTIATVELDPATNSMASVAKLRAKTWPRAGWAFLRGTPEETKSVLRDYNITVLPPKPGHDDVVHSVEVYVINPQGRESEVLAPGVNLTLANLERAVSLAHNPGGKT